MADPVSWYAIEAGWDVQDRAGAVVGEVTEVVGDQDADIFDGLRFEGEDGEERYVEAERVGEIVEGTVTIEAERDELEEGDDEVAEPGGAEIRADPEPGI
jgi:alkylation response protein AidB-like acyl-CoA dehydrogenase